MNSVLDSVLVAAAVNDDGVLLVDLYLLSATELVDLGLLDVETKLLGDNFAACQDSDILQHFLTSVAKARSFDSYAYEYASQLVQNDVCQSVALNVFSDDDELLASLYDLLEQRQNVLNRGDLLIGDENVRIVDNSFHLIGISYHVGGDVAAVELHAFNYLGVGLSSLALFKGDNAVSGYLLHSLSDKLAD